jgi:RNA polymerase sigma-70 factor (ECF subfamily)
MNVTSKWVEDEFEAIFREHFGRLMRVSRRVLGSDAEAEEVCSDVFLRLYRSGPGAIADGSAGGWLYRVGTRAAVDALRRNRRRHEEEFAEDAGETLPAHTDDPLGSVLRAELIGRVREALARMQVEKAQLLLLRHSGLSYREISTTMKIGATSVGKMLARAEAEFSKIYQRQQRMSEAALRLEAAKEGR